MAIALEVKYGNAKVFVCDDLCSNISPDEIEKRKLKVRETIGRIAASPGAGERLAASIAQKASEPPVETTYCWLN